MKYRNKKTFAAVTVSLMIFISALFPLAAFAGADSGEVSDAKAFSFSDPGYLDFVSGSNIQSLDYLSEDDGGFMRVFFTPLGGDPFVYLPIGMIPDGINCDEYYYLAINVRSKFATHCQLYFGTSNESGLDESKNVRSVKGISGSGEWETVVYYFGDNFKWNGMLTTARFDPYSTVPDGMSYMDIRWMAFVKNEEDLAKIDASLKDIQEHETYTRRPVYSTPDRTRPPENTFRPAVSAMAPESEASGKGFSSTVLIIVSSVLIVFAGIAAVGIVAFRSKKEK